MTNAVPSTPFSLTMIQPFSTFHNGQPSPIPYLIEGLLPSGAFSVIAGKPKHGKSSLARYEAVCVAKGQPFLGRDTERGEVVLISLEDPSSHIDNHLSVLGYDPKIDAPIHIVTRLAPRIDDSIAAIEAEIVKNPAIRLVIVDTLPKLLRSDDLNDYSGVLHCIEKVSALARRHPHIHIQGLAHSKKVKTDDPFDSLLGSTALRGEPDTTVVLYGDSGQRVIAAETRIGRSIPATLLRASVVASAGAEVVSSFNLEMPFAHWQRTHNVKGERQRKATHEERIIACLQDRHDHSAPYSELLEDVAGKTALKIEAVQRLIDSGVITTTGTRQSKSDPLILHLNESELTMNDFLKRYSPDEVSHASN
ncbi:MAG: AAA family ATPase [Acidobacteriota bacterium]|nr:AAA family ATPase [Acidobacteriota bacterium]